MERVCAICRQSTPKPISMTNSLKGLGVEGVYGHMECVIRLRDSNKSGGNAEMKKYMMATTAIHKLGDISRDEPDLCCVTEEHEDHYVGMWVTGFGFLAVKFPKSSTRELTEDELTSYQTKHIAMSGMDLGTAIPADYSK